MKKIIGFLVLAIMLVSIYLYGLKTFTIKDVGTAPVIKMENDHITIQVDDPESVLLQGVEATDIEDGNLTADLIIDNVSPFDNNSHRTITYAVIDNDNHVTKATRTLDYSNYKAPRFSFSNSMIIKNISTNAIHNLLKATSSVDGNVTERISTKESFQNDYKSIDVTASVTDSTGTTTSLRFACVIDNTNYGLDIILDKYLVYLKQGSSFDPMSLVKDVKLASIEGLSLPVEEYENILVSSDVDTSHEGVYYVDYMLAYNNERGRSRCVVVVE